VNALVLAGGGPTAVVNASIAGVMEACRRQSEIQALFGARNGVAGLLAEQLVDLSRVTPELQRALAHAPGCTLGSSRRDLDAADFQQAVRILRTRRIRWVFPVGGNGTMEMALRLAREALDLRVVAVPKTIDNDLYVTDHTPGYASAARFAAFLARDAGEDNRSLPAPIMVLETLGRNTGWITAATALARHRHDDAPHLIYLPERPVSADRIIGDVEQVYRRWGRCVVAICEGQRDERGRAFGADELDAENARRRLPANLGFTLARLISQRLGVRARAEKPGLFGRSAAAYFVERDRYEAWRCGEEAVRAAVGGWTGASVALRHDGSTFLTSLDTLAGRERPVPSEWIASTGNDVRPEFLEWLRPLVGPVPALPRLE
jgi:6-phosphofructokinase